MIITLKVTVEYEPNGVPAEELCRRLEDIARHASGEGSFTGSSDAEVITAFWSTEVQLP